MVELTITDENLETGLRGYPCGYCTTSSVDPEKGLYYVGQPVSEMTDRSPESVIFLLYNGYEGTEDEISAFARELHSRGECEPSTLAAIQALPRNGHPMHLFSVALLLLGMLEGTGDYREDCLDVIAKVPQLVAHVINHHAGWGGCRSYDSRRGYMENFTHMLNVPKADEEALSKVFRLFNVLHYDHGGGNLSAFVGKATASGLADMYQSLSSAMNALAGPRHGKANQDCLEFVKVVLKQLGSKATAQQVNDLIRKRLDNKELVFGFGHAVLRVEDPRATVQYQVAQEMYPENDLVKIALLLRQEGPKVLSENPKISNPYPNVDAISGTLLTAAGFPWSEYYTVLFGLSRCVGIARQIVYERCEAREGKGTPIVRPKYLYKAREPAKV
ncbi:MAG: citrate (Si)-synthase [Chlamydiia bacterium]|nr:citrate (Si)-synthase [Chlamydiia bacterium]